MNKKYLHLFIGLIIIAFSLYYAFRGVKLSELTHALMSVRYIYLLPAIFLILLSYLLRAMRWRYLVRPVKDVKTKDLFSPLMVGFMSNMLPARAGEFIRAYLLSKRENISFSSSFATIFIERLFDLIVLLLLIMWTLLFMPESLIPKNQSTEYQIIDKVKIFGAMSFFLCAFIFIFSIFLQFKHDWTLKVVGIFIKPFSLKWRDKIIGLIKSFSEGLSIIRDRQGFMSTIVLSLLIWTVFVLTYYPLFFALGINSELAISSTIVLCLAVAIFITLAPTPGFLGSYHLACVVVLHGIYGIQKAVALSYGIVAWLLAMGLTVAIGSVYALKDHVTFSEFSAKEKQLE